jgi:hypothetical protein
MQRACAYTRAVCKTVKATQGDGRVRLTLTMSVMMKFLQQNNLQELLSNVELVEEYLLYWGVFTLEYSSGCVVVL